jgi:acetoin utilization deacetylase AcuC-like enzyme
MMKIIYTEAHRKRAAQTELAGGELVSPFECPERMDFILKRLADVKFGPMIEPHDVSFDAVREIHSADYLNFLDSAWDEWAAAGFKGEAIPSTWPSRSMPSTRIPDHIDGKLGYYALAAETSISKGTAQAAWTSAGVALSAADHILGGERTAFALSRPPGHHASRDQYGGYCFINNAAAAAQHMRNAGLKKIAVLDVDFHHGNGTQAIFYDRADVMFLSLHGDPMMAFPYFLGHADETGSGVGAGFNVNYPMLAGTAYEEWVEALNDALQRIQQFGAEAVVISLGVDTFERDPISFFKLTSDDFTRMGQRIASINLPTLFVMEGGYAVKDIGINTVNVLTGFEDGSR